MSWKEKTSGNMRTIKKILLIIGFIAIVGFVIISDVYDRGRYYSTYTPKDEFQDFHIYTAEEQQKVYEKNFGNRKYRFPRESVTEVKLFKNAFLIGRLTSKTVSESNRLDLISFFNNPINFDWSETTWNVTESEYILRFYDEKNNEIGKIWLCIEDCGMIKSIPFSPNMKYGGLSETGMKDIKRIINKILNE